MKLLLVTDYIVGAEENTEDDPVLDERERGQDPDPLSIVRRDQLTWWFCESKQWIRYLVFYPI